MKLKELTNKEFEDFTKLFYMKSIYQTVEYAFTMSSQNYDSILVGLIDDSNTIVAASLILIEKFNKFKYAYAPKGFLIDYNNTPLVKKFTDEIKIYLNKIGVMAIKINPIIIKATYDIKKNTMTKNSYYDIVFNNLKAFGYTHLGYNNFFESLRPRFEAIVDIGKPYYNIFSNIRKEFRTKIRGAESKGIEVYHGTEAELKYLYLQTKQKYPRDIKYFKDCYKYFSKDKKIDLFYTTLDTHKYLDYCQRTLSEQELQVALVTKEMSDLKQDRKKILARKMKEDQELFKRKKDLVNASKLLAKYPDGIITSSILTIKNHDEINVLMDGYDPKFKNFNSKHLLIWKLMEKYSKEGYKRFNLAGLTAINIVDNPYKGLNDFKLGFNPIVIEFIGDLELVTNHTMYVMNKKSNSIKQILKK